MRSKTAIVCACVFGAIAYPLINAFARNASVVDWAYIGPTICHSYVVSIQKGTYRITRVRVRVISTNTDAMQGVNVCAIYWQWPVREG